MGGTGLPVGRKNRSYERSGALIPTWLVPQRHGYGAISGVPWGSHKMGSHGGLKMGPFWGS